MGNWIKNQQDLKNLKIMLESYINDKQDEINSFNLEEVDKDDYYEALDELSYDLNDLKVLAKFRSDIESVDDLNVINGLIKNLNEDSHPSAQWWYDQIKREFDDNEFKYKNNRFKIN